MKKIALSLLLIVAAVLGASAQKFALVDMEYILKNVPAYEMANEQLNQLSQRWQKEVEALSKEADAMYKQYLSDKVFLTEEQVKKREAEIVAKEQEATELRYKYFGPEGERLSTPAPRCSPSSATATDPRRPCSKIPPQHGSGRLKHHRKIFKNLKNITTQQ